MSDQQPNTALVLRSADTTLEPVNVREAHWLAEQLATGEATGKARSPGSVLAVMLCGRELGLTTMQSVRAIHLIDGKPSLSSDLMIALVRRSPACKYFRLVESTDAIATYETWRADEPKPTEMSFTIKDAERANLVKKDNWRHYPRAMLRARCIAELARAVYPEVLFGIYAEGELEDAPPAHGVVAAAPRIIDAEVVQPVTPARPVPQPVVAAEPQLTQADIAASVEAAPDGLELRPPAPGEEPPAPSLSQDEMDQLDCDNLTTEMMAAPDVPALNGVAQRAAERFPDKQHRHRQLLAKTVYPRALARIQKLQGQAA